MTSPYSLFETVVILLVGVLSRLAIGIAFLAAVTLPILAVVALVHAVTRRRRTASKEAVHGFAFRDDRSYAPGHTWLRDDAGRLTVGVDDLAGHLLPHGRLVSLAAPGTHVERGGVLAVLSAANETVTVHSPVEGDIKAANFGLAADPEAVHRDPYEAGWLVSVDPADKTWRRLPTGRQARRWFSGEAATLGRLLESHLGLAAADGGELTEDPMALLNQQDRVALRRRFLDAA